MQAEQAGSSREQIRGDILRYLRHEMGHVINYAYRLYDEPEMGPPIRAITQP